MKYEFREAYDSIMRRATLRLYRSLKVKVYAIQHCRDLQAKNTNYGLDLI